MTIRLFETLKKIGASDEDARESAREVYGFEIRQAKIETTLTYLQWTVTLMFGAMVAGFGLVITQLMTISTRL